MVNHPDEKWNSRCCVLSIKMEMERRRGGVLLSTYHVTHVTYFLFVSKRGKGLICAPCNIFVYLGAMLFTARRSNNFSMIFPTPSCVPVILPIIHHHHHHRSSRRNRRTATQPRLSLRYLFLKFSKFSFQCCPLFDEPSY